MGHIGASLSPGDHVSAGSSPTPRSGSPQRPSGGESDHHAGRQRCNGTFRGQRTPLRSRISYPQPQRTRQAQDQIATGGQQVLLGIATGNLPGVITDKAGTKHDVGFPYLIVPGRGHSTSSSSSSDAATRGIKTVIETGTLVWKGATS